MKTNKIYPIEYTKDYALLIDKEAEIIPQKTLAYNHVAPFYQPSVINHHQILSKIQPFSKDGKVNLFQGIDAVIAYYPLTEEAKELDLPLLPNPFDPLESLYKKPNIKRVFSNSKASKAIEEVQIEAFLDGHFYGFEEGYKVAQSKQFSLEDVKNIINYMNKNYSKIEDELAKPFEDKRENLSDNFFVNAYNECLDRAIQSVQTLPKEFIPEYETKVIKHIPYPKELEVEGQGYEKGYPVTAKVLKTTTNPEGKQELVGNYKY